MSSAKKEIMVPMTEAEMVKDMGYSEKQEYCNEKAKRKLDAEADGALVEVAIAEGRRAEEFRRLRECGKKPSLLERTNHAQALGIMIGYQIGNSLIWGTVVVLCVYIIAVLRKTA